MKLLKVTETEYSQFEEMFEEVDKVPVERLAPEVVDGRSSVRLNGATAAKYDVAFLEIPEQKPVFGRVVAEMLGEHGLGLNYSGMAFFIMAKKNYLSYVLHQKNVAAPETVSLASEKASRNVQEHLDFPVVARKYDEMKLVESNLIEEQDQLAELAEGIEYGEDMVLLQEYMEGDKYRIFYCDGVVASLEDRTEGWRISSDSLQYSNVSSEIRDEVKKAMDRIGARYGEVLVRSGEIVDINPNPDLEKFTSVSGKNAFEKTAEILRSEKV